MVMPWMGFAMRLFFDLSDVAPADYAARVAPILHRLTAQAEIHAMFGGEGDIVGVQWHVPQDGAALGARVGADLTFAAGREAAGALSMAPVDAAPFPARAGWFVLQKGAEPFGHLPEAGDCVAQCVEGFAPLWDVALGALPERGALRGALDLPQDRRVFAVPLRDEQDVARLEGLIANAPEDVLLAVSHRDCPRVVALLAERPDRLRAFAGDEANAQVIAAADALVGGFGAAWSLAAYAGVPIWNVGGAALAPWLGASADPAQLSAPDARAVRDWFAWRLAGGLVRPEDMDLPRLLRHVAGAPLAQDIAGNVAAVSGLMMG
jgi:hypothetical protein